MPLEYLYEPDANCLRIVGRGTVTMEERVNCLRRMFEDASLPTQANVLIDIDGVSNAPQEAEVSAIGVLIDRLRARFGGRVGILNTTVGHVTISNLIALSTDDDINYVRVFASAKEAQQWFADAPRRRSNSITTG